MPGHCAASSQNILKNSSHYHHPGNSRGKLKSNMNNIPRRFSEPSLRRSSLIVQNVPSCHVTAMNPFATSILISSAVSNNPMKKTSFLERPTYYSQYDSFDPHRKLYPSILYTTLEEEESSDSINLSQVQQPVASNSDNSIESHKRKRRFEDPNLGNKNPDPRPAKSFKSLVKRLSTTILNPKTFRRSRSEPQLDIRIEPLEYPGPLRRNENVLVFGNENPEVIEECTSDFYKTYFPYLAVGE